MKIILHTYSIYFTMSYDEIKAKFSNNIDKEKKM